MAVCILRTVIQFSRSREPPLHLFELGALKCTPFFGIFSKNFSRKNSSFTCSHWEEWNYRVFLKIFLFCKRPLHSFGQRALKCTPILRFFMKNFLRKNLSFTYLELQSQMTPYFTEKNEKIFFVRLLDGLFLLAKKVPSLIPTENGQMPPLISKKFIPSLIWNWSVKTQPVSEKNFWKRTKKFARRKWRARNFSFSTLWISEKKLLILHKSSKIFDMRNILWYTLLCIFISTWKWGLKMDSNIERWYSMKEICEYLGVSRDTVLAWIDKREMPATKIGRLWKFKISEVDAWMKSGVAAEK